MGNYSGFYSTVGSSQTFHYLIMKKLEKNASSRHRGPQRTLQYAVIFTRSNHQKGAKLLGHPPMNCKEHGNSLLLGEIPPIGLK